MKTAIDELIEYFIEQQKKGCSNWCIHDLIAKLYKAKEIEKEQIMWAHESGIGCIDYGYAEDYYNETFKSKQNEHN